MIIICRYCGIQLQLDFMENWVDASQGDGCPESPSMVHIPKDY